MPATDLALSRRALLTFGQDNLSAIPPAVHTRPTVLTPTTVPSLAAVALNRMAFGPRPGDFADFEALAGDDAARLQAYIDQQLDPANIDDSVLDDMIDLKVASGDMPSLYKTRQELWLEYKKAATSAEQKRPYEDLIRYRFLRALYSKRQLVDVLADFWHDHFNVNAGLGIVRSMVKYLRRATHSSPTHMQLHRHSQRNCSASKL
ncbi:MAG: DUF1800 domain-containing protein [Chloroflexi bacterium]|nr:DUF1800 domain-containing protein [Chloroflexota bacterium]